MPKCTVVSQARAAHGTCIHFDEETLYYHPTSSCHAVLQDTCLGETRSYIKENGVHTRRRMDPPLGESDSAVL